MKKELQGGREGQIFREGNAVIRPMNSWSKEVHDFLSFLDKQGVESVPRPLKLTEASEYVSFVPGEVFNDPLPQIFFTDQMIISAAELLSIFHERGKNYIYNLTGSEKWMLKSGDKAEIMCHGDFAPYNVTIIDNKAFGIIDFDTLHPGSKMEDVAYAVYRWCLLDGGQAGEISWSEKIRKIKLFLDIYGFDEKDRVQLPGAITKRLLNLVSFMEKEASKGTPNFQKNIEDGHVKKYLTDIEQINKRKKRIISGIRNTKF
ncbi:aminoglycoside phosphotransferase family protein [Enterococcus sp. BWT-B8]|uniref:phosphotransferase n=1 Tax=unclassified Enterococcus TaxID=2608891 RepID=UPI001E59132B|nr:MULTISPECIES: aminoglycoside phosphotransferase family protein [unclassified Enterococcus]MCB5950663.1 aminoglycoside phosphotransferase family protein [Enterococcus sp. BWT-B8]MCB5955638.1 aminoglycoside phosphotransferase family protein [Enterococcus sp. CWB-B31]